jgi:hypothetical protein
MGFFDWYEPRSELLCPVCGRALSDWRGYDGPNALFVWRQGHLSPVDQRVDEEVRLAPEDMASWRLPKDFVLYSDDCGCPFPVEAFGTTLEGIWTTTTLVSIDNATQKRHERRAEWKARRAWLARGSA